MTSLYATFWLRVAAFFIDILLIAFFFYIFKNFLPQIIGLFWINILFSWLYFALFHSSSWKATIGKKIVGIQVVKYDGERIDFKQASLRYFVSLISTTLILPYLSIVFTKRKQAIHDMLAKTVVVDAITSTKDILQNSENFNEQEQSKQIKKISLKRKLVYILLIIFIGVLLYTIFPFVVLFIAYSYMYIEKDLSYNKSFHILYQERDYNDSRINFYKKELERSSKGLVNAKGVVDIFEYDTKVDLSLECIEYYMKDNNETEWIEEGSKYANNARNKFAINNDLIKNVKNNADNMGRNFYLYDLNLVNGIQSDMTNFWGDKSNQSLCEQNLSANQLYDVFLTNYLAQYIENHISSNKRKSSVSDNHQFLQHKYKTEKEWLEKITKKSSLDIYKQFSSGKITLEDVLKDNQFKASLETTDVVLEKKEFIVADRNRGIELWNINSNNTVHFQKILTDKYKALRIKRVNNILYVAANGKQRGSFFLIFSYDENTKSLTELDKVQMRFRDWKFFDKNKKVAIVGGYDRMLILDISNPKNIKIIRKEKPDRTNNMSFDLVVNEKTNKLYEITSRSLNIFDIKNDSVLKSKVDYSLKGQNSLAISQEDNTLYTLHMMYGKKGSDLKKYSLDNPNKPKLILSKQLDMNYEDWSSAFFANMKIHKDRLYIAAKNNIHIFDKELNEIQIRKTPNIKYFYFLKNKIIYTAGKNGLVFLDNRH